MSGIHENERNKKGDDDVGKTLDVTKLEERRDKITAALKEVEMIRAGKLPRKSAREFLQESRND